MSPVAKRPARKRPRPKQSNAAQSQRFIDKARELGVDETGAEFERTFQKVVPKKQK